MKIFGAVMIQLGILIILGLGPVIYFWDTIFPNASDAFMAYIYILGLVSPIACFVTGAIMLSD
jgi:hypothetical protein